MKKYAFLFPGQGSQSVGMGKEFYENFTLAKELCDEASEAIKSRSERRSASIESEGKEWVCNEQKKERTQVCR